jgi:hypothetical protein
MAIAAMIRMIATTINSSINEKPFEFFFIRSSFTQVITTWGFPGNNPNIVRQLAFQTPLLSFSTMENTIPVFNKLERGHFSPYLLLSNGLTCCRFLSSGRTKPVIPPGAAGNKGDSSR